MQARLRETIICNTVIIGTGAAGYNAADSLWDLGQKDIIIVSENRCWGTSRNAGSDKQTYYKLSLCGIEGDSPRQLAQTLYDGHAMDGDIALCEAALSVPSFFKLVSLGVPFPKNRYGEYVGYKTDHDPFSRGSSVGPYTSKIMTEKLEKSVQEKNIPLHDFMLAIKLIVSKNETSGILCLDLAALKDNKIEFVYYNAKNVIFATGGPGGIYKNSVYPTNHFGGSGIAFAEGVAGRNLTEWQYGLASINPRWNVSGSYMQVLPRFISTDENGKDENEFLLNYFENRFDLLHKVFLKGYQWPFDVRKINDGSSLIDVLVFLEIQKGRRVFLDYQNNPGMQESIDYNLLPDESRNFLTTANVCFGTPFDRLYKLNKPAVDLYMDKGIDLSKEPLEIALSAQHNNGGIAVNLWWETNFNGVFAVGEASGTHGVYRPGGSALNEGQVGSLRAAEYIASKRQGHSSGNASIETIIQKEIDFVKSIELKQHPTVEVLYKKYVSDMSNVGSAFRETQSMYRQLEKVKQTLSNFTEEISVSDMLDLELVFRLRNILQTQLIYLSAFADYADKVGLSRGSSLYYNKIGETPYSYFPENLKFLLDNNSDIKIQEIIMKGTTCSTTWRSPNPIPNDPLFFENVWAQFRENSNIY